MGSRTYVFELPDVQTALAGQLSAMTGIPADAFSLEHVIAYAVKRWVDDLDAGQGGQRIDLDALHQQYAHRVGGDAKEMQPRIDDSTSDRIDRLGTHLESLGFTGIRWKGAVNRKLVIFMAMRRAAGVPA